MTKFDKMTLVEMVSLHEKEGICAFIEDGSCAGIFKEEKGEINHVQTA